MHMSHMHEAEVSALLADAPKRALPYWRSHLCHSPLVANLHVPAAGQHASSQEHQGLSIRQEDSLCALKGSPGMLSSSETGRRAPLSMLFEHCSFTSET